MNVLLLTSHSIAEHDDLDMFTRMGVPTFSIGAYTEPQHPGDDKRPALPHAIYYPALHFATDDQRARLSRDLGDPGPAIDWAKARLAPEVIDWADTVIVHHFPEQWIGGNWDALDGKRVIWRTCGQSDPRLERVMSTYRERGMQIVRYSERERAGFGDVFAGQDVVIPFGKDPDVWNGWTGDDAVVGNITQHMAQRGDACGYRFWAQATAGLPNRPAGPGSEVIGGTGSLSYDAMRAYLRSVRVYLYTGTQPASYTLGALEAAMTGVPVVSVGPNAFGLPGLCDFGLFSAEWGSHTEDPRSVQAILARYLERPNVDASRAMREAVVRRFGLGRVMAQWAEFLA